MSEPATIDPHAEVSVEQDGRILSGVGVSKEDLAATMDRHTPEQTPEAPGAVGGGDVPPAAPASTPEAPLKRGQARFADLTRERDAAKSETAAERTKREGLEREVIDLRQQIQQASTPRQAQQAQTQLTQAEQRLAPQAQQQRPQFQFPSYEEAVAQYPDLDYDGWRRQELIAFSDWKDSQVNIDARISQALAAERATQSFVQTVAQTHAKARTAYKDFDTLLTSGPGSQIPLGPTPDIAVPRARYVIQHPQSEHLQHAILRDGDLARRLQQMSDLDFGMTIASLVPSGGAQPLSAQHGAMTPPAPFQPVGGGSSTTVTPSSELAKRGFDFDKSGYREKRAAERGLKARR